MIAFILKVSLCWLFFYGVYELFLKNKTFFKANRTYLLLTLIVGIILPLLEFIPWKNESNVAHVIYPMLMEIDDLQAVVTSKQADEFNWMNILYFIYGVGFIVSFVRFSMGVKRILELFRSSKKITNKGYTLVLTEEVHLPFSFFKWVFFSQKMTLDSEIDEILHHEIEHIKGKHSFDILFTEFLKVLFWCSPMIYLYKNALKEVHEYLADHVVLKNTDKKTYKRLLLTQTNNSLQMALTHQFFNSHLKNRLKMINQKRSGRPTLVMYALGIPVLLLLLFAFTYSLQPKEEIGSKMSSEDNPLPELIVEEGHWNEDLARKVYNKIAVIDTIPNKNEGGDNALKEEIFKVVEQMPRFPGCEDLSGTNAEKNSCSKGKMLEYIYHNLKYPKAAKDAGVEGMAVVQFVITNEGNIKDAKIVRSLSAETDDATLNVVRGMSNMAEKWTPGYQTGKAVNVMYTLPVRFKLDEKDKEKEKVVEVEKIKSIPHEGVNKVVKEIPEIAIVYIDGKLYEGDIEDIDSDKIGCISVVKGQTAIDEYGVKGEQGVVEITTKKAIEEVDAKEKVTIKNSKAEVTEIRLRSKGAEPLYILDGVVLENAEYLKDEVNPDDIKSISVLKDEKAVDKYGQKGANGVIEITTKKGEKEVELFQEGANNTPAFFPGCDDLADAALKDKCSKTNLLKYVYSNLRYPESARDKGIQGMVVTSFIIDEEGKMNSFAIKRSTEGLDESAMAVINKMAQEIVWVPAKKDGKPVAMEFNLPVKFKLHSEPAKTKKELEDVIVELREGEALQVEDLAIFPNPAQDVVNIKFKAEAKPVILDFFNIEGKQLYQKVYTNFNGNFDQTINLNQFAEKMILIRLRQEGKSFTQKLVIE